MLSMASFAQNKFRQPVNMYDTLRLFKGAQPGKFLKCVTDSGSCAWVTLPSSSLSANNGLTKVVDSIQLGGSLSKQTEIIIDSNLFYLYNKVGTSMYVGVVTVYPNAYIIGWANRALDDSISHVTAELLTTLDKRGDKGTRVVLNAIDNITNKTNNIDARPLEGINSTLNPALILLYNNASGNICDSCTITGDAGQTAWLYFKWDLSGDSLIRITPISGDWLSATSFTDSLGNTADIADITQMKLTMLDGNNHLYFGYDEYTGHLYVGNSQSEKNDTVYLRNNIVFSDLPGELGMQLTYGPNGNAIWEGGLELDSIATSGATVTLLANTTHIVTASGAITNCTFNFPAAQTNDEIVIHLMYDIALLTFSGTGISTITTPVRANTKLSGVRIFHNYGGNWY